MALLCQPAEFQGSVRLPDELGVWGIDSGIRHAVTGADYGAVRVGAFMGYRILAELAGLRVTPGERDGHVRSTIRAGTAISPTSAVTPFVDIAPDIPDRPRRQHVPGALSGHDRSRDPCRSGAPLCHPHADGAPDLRARARDGMGASLGCGSLGGQLDAGSPRRVDVRVARQLLGVRRSARTEPTGSWRWRVRPARPVVSTARRSPAAEAAAPWPCWPTLERATHGPRHRAPVRGGDGPGRPRLRRQFSGRCPHRGDPPRLRNAGARRGPPTRSLAGPRAPLRSRGLADLAASPVSGRSTRASGVWGATNEHHVSGPATASAMMRCSVQSARSSTPVTRPSCMTTTRSLRCSTSSMSLLIITIDTPSRASAPQQPVDFRLGADVDAARRLVDDQHLRREREPLGEHDLLLVAAAQRGDLRPRSTAL